MTPWFPFYASDFYASTVAWPPEVVGAYIRLLCFAWENGGIPADPKAIDRIAGGVTDEGWDAIRSRLVLLDGDRDGDRHGQRVQRWVHPRMERERERTDTIRKARQDAAAATNRKRGRGDRDGQRDGDCIGERVADRVVTTTTTTHKPPVAPLKGGGRAGMSRRERKAAEAAERADPNWVPF